MTMNKWWIAAAGASALLTVSAPVFACGGFFCNTGAPVNQTGEQILFAVEDGHVEAHVAVQYAGPSEDFAWIVPTPALPEVGVSSAIVFSRLDQLLRAQYYGQWFYDGECGWQSDGDFNAGPPSAGGGRGEEDEGADPGVTIIEQSQVGPYDYVILQATAVDPLFEWLRENAYDLPDVIEPFVEPYVLMDDDVHFVAFKLSKNRDAGDITPVVLRYESNEPMIPIQLTAVATVPDMGVTATVLGQHRSVPENYLHVEINEARIDWINSGSNYGQLINEAMDEAGGQGFATEFAGASSVMANQLWRDDAFDLERLAAISDPIEFWGALQEMFMNIGMRGDGSILGLLEQFIPMPEDLVASGVQPQDFYNCLDCYRDSIDFEGFDPAGFVAALEETVVGPLSHAQDLFDRIPYTTRLYTTLSAEEMTVDPYFTFNPDMGDVANIHYAEIRVQCDPDVAWNEQSVRIVLPDGREVRSTLGGGDRDALDALPAAESIAETGASGPPRIVDSRTEAINDGIDRYNDQFASLRDTSAKRGCTAGASAGGLLFGLFGLLGARRRRNA